MKGKAILRSLLLAYGVTGLFLLILAFLLFQFEFGGGTAAVGISIIYVVSCLVGGFMAGKIIRKDRYIWGIVTGLSYYVLLLLVSILALVYCKYKETSAISNILSSLRPAVVALITAAGFSMFQTAVLSGKALHISSVNVFALLLFIAAFIALRKWKLNPILIMCLCGVANLFFTLLKSANF